MTIVFIRTHLSKILQTLLLVIFVFLPHNAWLNNLAENYTDQGIERALITYAISRSLNGVISVAQGTEIAVSPVGVGLTFAPGQILDPINDLIERFSWVVLVSGTSLGIQKLFLEITSIPAISWAVSVLSTVFITLIWFCRKHAIDFDWASVVKKILLVLIFFRFSIPLIAVINEGLYLSFLQSRYEQSQTQLMNASDKIQLINASAHEKIEADTDKKSLFENVERWLNKTQQSLDLEKQMSLLKQAASDVSQQVINMIVVFVVQAIIFPLLFLWLIIQGAKALMRQFFI